MRRRQYIDSRQLPLGFAARTYRAAVLEVLESSADYMSARIIAAKAGITYNQAIFALFALHEMEKIHRKGRKATARWGKLALVPAKTDGLCFLENIFFVIIKR